MKPDQESLPLLRRLHERVFADREVRAVLDAGFAQLALELEGRVDPPHASCTVPIELFTGVGRGRGMAASEDRVVSGRHGQIRLCRLFLLRRGTRMAVPERHRNSVQRLVSYRGSGRIRQGTVGGRRGTLRSWAITKPDEADVGIDAPGGTAGVTDLARHWDIVPAGVWHYPEADGGEDWATVTFHSAAEGEIVDELWSENRRWKGMERDQP